MDTSQKLGGAAEPGVSGFRYLVFPSISPGRMPLLFPFLRPQDADHQQIPAGALVKLRLPPELLFQRLETVEEVCHQAI